jgi:DMSO reductase family type II enzyme chaperone
MPPDTQQILARSKLYKLFALTLHYPGTDLIEMFNEGLLAESFACLLEIACPDLCVTNDLSLLEGTADDLELGAEYNRLFEVGEDGHAPCSLFGGAYSEADRHTVLEETVRFYNHFGLQIDHSHNEMPDQLGTELEFLHFLAYRQVELLNSAADSGDYARAERDFLQRHPGKWVPAMQRKLEQENGKPFYNGVVNLLKAYLHEVMQSTALPTGHLIPVSAQH